MSAYGYSRPSAPLHQTSQRGPMPDLYAAFGGYAQSSRTYSLQIIQEPISALASGLDAYAYSRMPIIPAIVLRLRVHENGRELRLREFVQDIAMFVCLVSLLPASSRSASQTLDFVHNGGQRMQVLIGQLVSDVKPLMDRQGEEVAYFIFDNISVRVSGDYCLRFRLTQAIPAAPVLAEGYSSNFQVQSHEDFDLPIDIANTDLTRHLRAQGIPLFLPPLT